MYRVHIRRNLRRLTNPPLLNLTVRRKNGLEVFGARAFSAILDEEEIGGCEYDSDVSKRSEMPAFRPLLPTFRELFCV